MRAKNASIAGPIIYGVLLVLVTLALTALWNIAFFTDWFRQQGAVSGWLYWGLLALAYVFFLALIIGLILFIVSLARQISLNQRQQNFIDSVTHELKTPLTSLKLHLETMQMRELPPEMQARFTALMLADVERLDTLIDHVLAAAQLEPRRKAVTLQDIALGPELERAVAIVTQRHGLPAGAIALDAPPLRVTCDPVALELVLVNLLDNAVKYSRDLIEVRVTARPLSAGRVSVAVADRGVGIPPRQLKRIFHRFHRVGNELTRTRKGTGLGLHIVKETMRQMKGDVKAHSAGENQGSVFTLTLPGARNG